MQSEILLMNITIQKAFRGMEEQLLWDPLKIMFFAQMDRS